MRKVVRKKISEIKKNGTRQRHREQSRKRRTEEKNNNEETKDGEEKKNGKNKGQAVSNLEMTVASVLKRYPPRGRGGLPPPILRQHDAERTENGREGKRPEEKRREWKEGRERKNTAKQRREDTRRDKKVKSKFHLQLC